MINCEFDSEVKFRDLDNLDFNLIKNNLFLFCPNPFMRLSYFLVPIKTHNVVESFGHLELEVPSFVGTTGRVTSTALKPFMSSLGVQLTVWLKQVFSSN